MFVTHVVKQMVFLDESYIGQPERYGRLLVQQSKDHKPAILDCKPFDNIRFNGLSFPGLRVNVDEPAYRDNAFLLQERLHALYPNVASGQILVNDYRAERLKLYGQAKARRQREGNNKEIGSSSGSSSGPRKKPRYSLLKNVLCSLPEESILSTAEESSSSEASEAPLLDMSSLDMFDMDSGTPNGIDIIVAAALAGTPESYWSSSDSSSSWSASPWYSETLDTYVTDDSMVGSVDSMVGSIDSIINSVVAPQPPIPQAFEQPQSPVLQDRSDHPSAIYNLFQMCCTSLSRSEFDTVCARRWTNVLMKRDTVLKCFEENDLQRAIDTVSGSGYYSFDVYAKRILAEPF